MSIKIRENPTFKFLTPGEKKNWWLDTTPLISYWHSEWLMQNMFMKLMFNFEFLNYLFNFQFWGNLCCSAPQWGLPFIERQCLFCSFRFISWMFGGIFCCFWGLESKHYTQRQHKLFLRSAPDYGRKKEPTFFFFFFCVLRLAELCNKVCESSFKVKRIFDSVSFTVNQINSQP